MSKETLEEILESLVIVLARTGQKKKMAELLSSLLSETERIMLAKRLAVVFLLSEGVREGSIVEALNVTPFTVSRLKLWFETRGQGYRVAVNELKRRRDLEFLKRVASRLTVSLIKSTRHIS